MDKVIAERGELINPEELNKGSNAYAGLVMRVTPAAVKAIMEVVGTPFTDCEYVMIYDILDHEAIAARMREGKGFDAQAKLANEALVEQLKSRGLLFAEGDVFEVTLQVKVRVSDPATLIAISRDRYAKWWDQADWFPESLGEALYENLIASNDNPESPVDAGFEICSSESVVTKGS